MNSPRESVLSSMIATARSMASGRRAFIVFGFWSLIIRVAGLLSGFALGVVLARILGPTQFGIYGLVATVAAVGMTVAQLGTPQLAVRELSVRAARGDWAGAKAILYEFGTATMLVGVSIGAVALAATVLVGSPTAILMLVIQGALLMLLMSFTGLFAAELRGLGALLKGQSMDITVRPGLTFIIVAALLLAGIHMDALVALSIQNAVTLAAAVVSALWLWRVIPRHARSIPAAKSVPWLRAALPLGAVDVLRQVDGSYGVVLVGWLSSGVELGVFRVAVACAVLAAMPVTIFHVLLAPTLSRLNQSGERGEMQRLLSWSGGAMVAIMVPIALGSWFFGRPLVALVFGAAYASGSLPLFLLTIAQLIYAIFGMGPILLAMCGGERDLIRIYAIGVVTAFIAAIPITMLWGGAGAALGPIISALFIGILSRAWAHRKLGVEITGLGLLSR